MDLVFYTHPRQNVNHVASYMLGFLVANDFHYC